ncbi:MAG TPA: AAA family ATPase [Acetobacteraceae bacterium]|nr:AAA family ATPase [Acetobacteraceae bacterium]
MTVPEQQREAEGFLRGLSGADPIETHISAVFLGRDTVWKMKKAVSFPYLDFTALAARHRFLLRELALNRAAAPGLYRDVVALVRRPEGGLALDGAGEPIEWVLRMARVPAGDFLDRIADEGRLTPELARALGRAVARYHAGLAPVGGVDHAGSLRELVAENRCSALAAGLPEPQVLAWEAALLEALKRREAWLAQRAAQGFVRRAHGDLHLGNLCLWQGEPVPFDALEFDERLATIDLGYDLAFLLMDLALRRNRANANRVLNAYVAESGDFGLVGGLPFFLSLRAMVRAHVQAARGFADEARSFLAAAADFLRPAAPALVAVGGLPGSGKSTLAHGLAPSIGAAPGALVLANDVLRKRRHGVSPETRLPDAAYTKEENRAVLAALLAAAGEIVGLFHAVIADATFLDPAHRAAIEAVAATACVPFVGFTLAAPLALLEERVRARGEAPVPDPSDATEAVLHRMAASASGGLSSGWHRLDASGPAEATLEAALATARRLAQPAIEPC